MVLKSAIALLAFVGAPLCAQSFPKPPDIPADFTQVIPTYNTTGIANVSIDPNVISPVAQELVNIPLASYVGRITTTDTNSTGAGGTFCLTTLNGGTCTQAKFRTLIGGTHTHVLCDDPIRNYGQPGQSHCHMFFGNNFTNAKSVYATLRGKPSGDAAGYDVNGTGYWFPAVKLTNPFADGKNYVVRPKFFTVYYLENDPAEARKVAHIPVGLRYVFGFEMDDQWAWLQTILTAANTAQGHARYSLTNPGNGMMGTEALYTCAGATATGVNAVTGQASSSKVIANADGSDPYGGTCASGADYYVNISGADCWDRTNLWSRGGYKNNIPAIWDSDFSVGVCPTNYTRLPTLGLEIHFSQQGWTDRQRWRLTSDDMYATACSCTVPSGKTFHTDWMYGWDSVIFNQIQQNCIGVENHTPHECNSSTYSVISHLIGGYAGENGPRYSPQTDTTTDYFTNAAANMYLLPATSNGAPTTIHAH